MKLYPGVAAVALLGMMGVGCGSGISAGADYERSHNFGPYRTFSWDAPDMMPTGDPRLDNNPIIDRIIQTAVEEHLARRGLRVVASDGEMLVHYHLSVRDRMQVYEVDRQRGLDVAGLEAVRDVVQYEEGTLLIDIADARAKRLIWRGWARYDLSSDVADMDRIGRTLQSAIGKIFEHYPEGRAVAIP